MFSFVLFLTFCFFGGVSFSEYSCTIIAIFFLCGEYAVIFFLLDGLAGANPAVMRQLTENGMNRIFLENGRNRIFYLIDQLIEFSHDNKLMSKIQPVVPRQKNTIRC